MGAPQNLLGQRFGRLVVLRRAENPPGRTGLYWFCQCDCGRQKVTATEKLRGGCKSCGCLVIEQARRMGKNNYRGGPSPRPKGVCQLCGEPTWYHSVTRCKKCYTGNMTGENNPSWGRFSSTKRAQGYDRALRRFKLGVCQRCNEKPAVDRHHLDDNPLNNSDANVLCLCRACHMVMDGRLDNLSGKNR
jgi:hypothetical protein